MAYYSLEDVAKLISFWHGSKQYEIVPCMFIFDHYMFCLFESIQLCEENGVSHVSFWHTKVDFDPPKENLTNIHCKQVVYEAAQPIVPRTVKSESLVMACQQ